MRYSNAANFCYLELCFYIFLLYCFHPRLFSHISFILFQIHCQWGFFFKKILCHCFSEEKWVLS